MPGAGCQEVAARRRSGSSDVVRYEQNKRTHGAPKGPISLGVPSKQVSAVIACKLCNSSLRCLHCRFQELAAELNITLLI